MNLLTNKELFETLKKKFIRTKFFSERLELLLGVVPSQIVGLKKIHLKSINNKNNKPKENSKASSEFEEKKSQDQKGFINLPTDILTQNTLDQSSDDDEHDKNQNFHDDHKTKSLNHNQKENILNINKINPYGYDRFKSDESDNENENENGNDKNNENTNNFDCLQQTQNENKIIIPNNIEFNREVLYLLENLTGISRRSLEWGLSSFIERNFGLHNIHPHNKQKIIFGKASLKKNKKKEKINLRKRKKKFKITYKKQTKENQKSNSLKSPIKEKSLRIKRENQTNTLNTNIAQKNKKKKTNPNQKRSPPKISQQETTVQKNDNYFTLPLKLSFSPPLRNKVSENNWLFEIEKKYSYEFD